jgi:hypothetical protein
VSQRYQTGHELYRVLLSLIDRLGYLGCPHQLKRRRPSISFLQATGASQTEVAYEWFNLTGASPKRNCYYHSVPARQRFRQDAAGVLTRIDQILRNSESISTSETWSK